jgi:tRNA-dihydrouridine synthase C
LAIAHHDAAAQDTPAGEEVTWSHIVVLMGLFWQGIGLRVAPRHRAGRLKQWLNYLRRVYPQAQEAFDQLRLMHDPAMISQWLDAQGLQAPVEKAVKVEVFA